ncbi:MAG: hypothetical protein LBR88_08725 [Zoogloeaceae bacterium]|nr:hypothetical protein [Zoogloeaceae bacterium]
MLREHLMRGCIDPVQYVRRIPVLPFVWRCGASIICSVTRLVTRLEVIWAEDGEEFDPTPLVQSQMLWKTDVNFFFALHHETLPDNLSIIAP